MADILSNHESDQIFLDLEYFCPNFLKHKCAMKGFYEEFTQHGVESIQICIATIQRGCFVKIANLRIITSQLAFSIIVVTIPYPVRFWPGLSLI